MLTDDQIRAVLQQSKTIAVVGLSDKPDRDSYGVAALLQRKGYRIIPVNPVLQGQQVLGEPVYASLHDIPEHVDIVDIFRRSDAVPPIVAEAIAIGATTVWMQLSVVHAEAAQQAKEAGLNVVMDRCIAIELRRIELGG